MLNTKEEFNTLLLNGLNVDSDPKEKKRSKILIKEIREALADQNLFNSSCLYNYRKNRKVPTLMLTGAALAYKILSSDNLLNSQKFYSSAFDFYYLTTGLKFKEINYKCHLTDGSIDGFLDAEIEVIYTAPQVHENFGSTTYFMNTQSDVANSSDIESNIEIKGPGISISEKPLVHKVSIFNQVTKNEITNFVTKTKININASANSYSKFIVRRKLKNGFAKESFYSQPNKKEQAGITIRRPTEKLSLQISFDESLNFNPIPITVGAWGPESINPNDFDSYKISSLLLENTQCRPHGNATWIWKSSSPPVVGMHYSLSYETLVKR